MAKTKIYCITCKREDMTHDEQAEAACLGGADAIVFVDKSLTPKEVMQIGLKMKETCAIHKIPLIIDSRPDIALAIDADGIHLDQNDIPLTWARQILGGRKTVVASVDTLGQALACAKDGVSMIMVGPMFAAKPGESRNADIVRLIKERVKVPVIAFGGLNIDNLDEVILAGADGIAVSRSICGVKDVTQALKDIRAKIESLAKV